MNRLLTRHRPLTALLVGLVLGVMGSLTIAPAGSARADVDGVSITWTDMSAAPTQLSGLPFTYRLNVACSSMAGQACQVDYVDVPLAVAYPGTTSSSVSLIQSWPWTTTSSPAGIATSSVRANGDGTYSLRIVFTAPITPGSSDVVTVTVTPPNLYTPNGTTWTLVPHASVDGAVDALTASGTTSTATASASLSARKTSSAGNLAVLGGSKVTYTLEAWTGTGTVGVLALTGGVMVDRLPAGATFVSATPAGYVYDVIANTVTWTSVPIGDSASFVDRTVTVTMPVPDGVYRNDVDVTGVPLGSSGTLSATSFADVTVSNPPTPAGNIFTKTAKPNWDDVVGTVSGTGAQSSMTNYLTNYSPAATAAQTSTPTVAELTIDNRQNAADIDFQYQDPMPCLSLPNGPGAGQTLFYSPQSRPAAGFAVCPSPVWDVTSVAVRTVGYTTTDRPPSLTLHVVYSDGSAADFPVTVVVTGSQTVVVDVSAPGKAVSEIDLSGTLPAKASGASGGFFLVSMYGALTGDGRLKPGDFVQNSAYGSAKWSWSSLWSPWSSTTANWKVMGDEYWAENTSLGAKYSSPYAQSGNFSFSGSGNWFNHLSAVDSVRAAAWVFPDAVTAALYAWQQSSVQTDYDGAGNARILVGGVGSASLASLMVNAAALPVGVYPLTSYYGYKDLMFPQCLNETGSGSSSQVGNTVVDTTGIIGSTPGVPTTLCAVTSYLVVTGASPSSSVTKFVRGDGDGQFLGLPGTAEVMADGTGSATFRLQFANTGSAAFDSATLYDVFPAAGDPRGSTMTPTLTAVPAAVAGWTFYYSTSANPCRPEVLPTNPGCANDWTTTAPADLATVKALKLARTTSFAVGTVQTFDLLFKVPAYDSTADVAWNQVSAGVRVTGEPAGSLLPAESQKVGVGRVQQDWSVTLVKTVTANGQPTAQTALPVFAFTFTTTSAPTAVPLQLSAGQASDAQAVPQGDAVTVCEAEPPVDSRGTWGVPAWTLSTGDGVTVSGRCAVFTPTGDVTVTVTNDLTGTTWSLPMTGGEQWPKAAWLVAMAIAATLCAAAVNREKDVWQSA